MKNIVFVTLICLSSASFCVCQEPEDSLSEQIEIVIDKIYRSKILNTSEETFSIGIEKECAERYGDVGECVVWNLLALRYYILYSKDHSNHYFSKWIKYKKRIYTKYPNAINAFDLNNDAWFVYEESANLSYINEALKWSKKATDLEPLNANWKDTYANLLYKKGNKKAALQVQEEAVRLDSENEEIKSNYMQMKSGTKQ